MLLYSDIASYSQLFKYLLNIVTWSFFASMRTDDLLSAKIRIILTSKKNGYMWMDDDIYWHITNLESELKFMKK